MSNLIYSEKHGAYGAVIETQSFKNERFYRINFDNKLDPNQLSSVPFYNLDMQPVKFDVYLLMISPKYEIEYKKIYSTISPKEAKKAIKEHKELMGTSKLTFDVRVVIEK